MHTLHCFIVFSRSRAFTTGAIAAINYILGKVGFYQQKKCFFFTSKISFFLAFFATKTYYDLELLLSIPGVIGFYGLIGVVGFIGMYFTLPETEMRTLEDIELHFSDNSKSITDINIRINSAADLTGIDVKQPVSEDKERY